MAQENERSSDIESDEMDKETESSEGAPSTEGGESKSKRGFAAMDEEKQREIARKGGKAQGKDNNPANFANDREKASEAGRKGGSQ